MSFVCLVLEQFCGSKWTQKLGSNFSNYWKLKVWYFKLFYHCWVIYLRFFSLVFSNYLIVWESLLVLACFLSKCEIWWSGKLEQVYSLLLFLVTLWIWYSETRISLPYWVSWYSRFCLLTQLRRCSVNKAVVHFFCFAMLALVLMSAIEKIRLQLPGAFQCKEKFFHYLN